VLNHCLVRLERNIDSGHRILLRARSFHTAEQ